jgi:hypothetical protein
MSWRRPPAKKPRLSPFEQQAIQQAENERALQRNVIYEFGGLRGGPTIIREMAEMLEFEGEGAARIARERAAATLRTTVQRGMNIRERMRTGQFVSAQEQRQMLTDYSPASVRQAIRKNYQAVKKDRGAKARRKIKLKNFKAPDIPFTRPPGGGGKPPPPPPPMGGAIGIRA